MPERRWRAAPRRRSPRDVVPPFDASHPGESREPQAGGAGTDLVIKRITLAGSLGTVLIVNRGATPIELSNWHLCQASQAFTLDATVLEPGQKLRIHLGAGDNTPDDWYAAGRLGEFSHDGELALYNGGPIGVPSSMAAYVAWGGGGPAQPIAQAARLWTETNLAAARGDTIVLTGLATGAHGYLVHPRDASLPARTGRDPRSGPPRASSAPEGRSPW